MSQRGTLSRRLAFRIALAGGIRSGPAVGVIVVLVGCIVASIYLLTALTATAQQRSYQVTGGDPASVSVQPTKTAIDEARAQLPKGARLN